MTLMVWAALSLPALGQDPAQETDEVVDDSQDAMLRALRAEIERQQQQLEAQGQALDSAADQLAEQQAALEDLQAQVTQNKLKLIPPDTLKAEFQGHYRVRAHLFNHLFESQTVNGQYQGDARYINQRLWFRPVLKYKELAKLFVEFRALENVVFGDNASLSSTAPFAGDPSNTGLTGLEVSPVTVGRAWMEFSLPVGLMRVGRQPAEWGMNLLVAPGDSFDQPFGESYYPTTNDRILFATRPVAIFDAITGRDDRGIPLIVAVAVDRLVEDPLFQYYGFQCSPGIPESSPDYERRCDSDGDGVTDQDHSYQEEDRTPESREQDWWADQADDVAQMVYVVAYRGEGVRYLGGTGDLTAGAWIVSRSQRETESDVLILDGYFKSFVHRVLLEGEIIRISGESSALTLPYSGQPNDPLRKDIAILGGAARLGYVTNGWKAIVEVGSASGDDDIADDRFTGRALHPDHNVGLLLYEEVLARVTSQVRTTGARGLWSNGGVYSSKYIFPRIHLMPLDNWEIVAGYVTAVPNKPDGAVIKCKDGDDVDCLTPSTLQATADTLGWEADLAIKHRWHEHLWFTLEGGIAHATDRLPLEAAGLNPEGNFFTVQSRVAFVF